MPECSHIWEVEYLPDPMSAGGVIRSGWLICTECWESSPDKEGLQ